MKKKKQSASQVPADFTGGLKTKRISSKKQEKMGNGLKIKVKSVKSGSPVKVKKKQLKSKKNIKKNVSEFLPSRTLKKMLKSQKQKFTEDSNEQDGDISSDDEIEGENSRQLYSINLCNKLNLNKESLIKDDENEIFDDVPPIRGSKFMGDISEEDIDSDDDLSLDENELPVPPDATTTEEESSEEEEVVEEVKPIDIQSQRDESEKRTVFVGNLPKAVNKSKLKKWFTKYGTVESVRLRCAPLADPTVPKKLTVIKKAFHEERNNIHGFVRFSTLKEATNALSANGEPFDEKHHLRVDMASKSGQSKRYDDKKALFVGNLPFNAEEDHLRDIFADCGDILSVRIVRDKNTAVGKGFGFINFAGRHSIRLALEKEGIELMNRKLRLQRTFYNQESNDVHQTPKITGQNKKSRNLKPVQKFKKKKSAKGNEGPEFQGLRSNKDFKTKKINEKKKKLQRKREKIKKILNSKSANK
ncbi:uncharacterized protein [Rhodnius prolixus]|uniref:uncharacterized protein n=1 Tax=Rhodnius prolixus TaxID=13249 RepID=UPI003D189910